MISLSPFFSRLTLPVLSAFLSPCPVMSLWYSAVLKTLQYVCLSLGSPDLNTAHGWGRDMAENKSHIPWSADSGLPNEAHWIAGLLFGKGTMSDHGQCGAQRIIGHNHLPSYWGVVYCPVVPWILLFTVLGNKNDTCIPQVLGWCMNWGRKKKFLDMKIPWWYK